ncbi:hypothetical protein Tco_1580933, partial [Tanacetum coccineum]
MWRPFFRLPSRHHHLQIACRVLSTHLLQAMYLSLTLSPGYIADSDLEDPEEDPKEYPADYPADGGDNDDDDDSSDDGDDDEDDDVEEDEEDEEEEEHLALADSSAIPTKDPVPSAEDTKAFETNESAPTPIPSPPLPLLAPHISSPTYAEAPLGYRAAKIQLRAASPPTHHPSEIPSPPLLLPSTTHGDDLPEADIPLRNRARFTTPTGRFEVGESSSAATARQAKHTLTHTVDYGFIDTLDANIRASESRVITVDDRALLGAKVSLLRRERRYFHLMASSYKREAVIGQQEWSHSKSKIQAMEAQIR